MITEKVLFTAVLLAVCSWIQSDKTVVNKGTSSNYTTESEERSDHHDYVINKEAHRTNNSSRQLNHASLIKDSDTIHNINEIWNNATSKGSMIVNISGNFTKAGPTEVISQDKQIQTTQSKKPLESGHRNTDLKIDAEFEHSPAEDLDYFPSYNLDPEFEHEPGEDSEYDFPAEEEYNFHSRKESNGGVRNDSDGTDVSAEDYYFDKADSKNGSRSENPVNTNQNFKDNSNKTLDSGMSQGQSIVPNTTVKDSKTSISAFEDEDYDYALGDDLIHESMKRIFFDAIDDKFRSLVFNPAAQPQEKFQECTTPRNESGQCTYVQHCFLPNIIASLGNFMNYVCIIQERYVGICCPEFPVHTLEVKWKLPENELSGDMEGNITEPEGGCGVNSKTRIVGGIKADPKEWPWMAALLSERNGKFFCGGSLINSRYVLTAAHCTFSVPLNQILVRLGEYDFTDSEDGPGEDYPVIAIKRHAQYSRKTLRNDIALLKLARSAKFGQFIGTICLPSNNAKYVGQMATLAGWGNVKGGGPGSKVLLEASFPVWNNAECSKEQGIRIRQGFICAGARTKDKGACNGDSGGPLMLLDYNKRWKAIGVVSWGRRGCDTKFPTVFTRISDYLDWIAIHSSL